MFSLVGFPVNVYRGNKKTSIDTRALQASCNECNAMGLEHIWRMMLNRPTVCSCQLSCSFESQIHKYFGVNEVSPTMRDTCIMNEFEGVTKKESSTLESANPRRQQSSCQVLSGK
jgi:hypothetical protein